ncbi:hypothetical protein BC835DRAFT_1359717 [Cytidiella melzeri]|nr:hypothetical protein BC835DRAFT_1359717 [Cytidiella melzeri]
MSYRNILHIASVVPWSNKNRKAATSREAARQEEPLLQRGDIEPGYGSVDRPGPSSGRSSRRESPEMHRRESTLNIVPEEDRFVQDSPVSITAEDEEEVEWNLEERGLYSGSYRRTVAMYSFVPLTSLALLIFLACCPSLFWRIRSTTPAKHTPYFPPPIPQLVLSSSLWSFGYLLRVPTYAVVSYTLHTCSPILTTLLFNALYVTFYNLLRLSSLPILRVRQEMKYTRPNCHDGVFRTIWWLALGWATIDVAVSILQSYAQIALYRNVMVPEERAAEVLARGNNNNDDGGPFNESQSPRRGVTSPSQEILPLSPRHEGSKPAGSSDTPGSVDEAIRLAVDQDLEQLVNLKEREDVEEIYGVPIIKIPVFVSCLQRAASILLSVGITLTLSASYLQSTLSIPTVDGSPSTGTTTDLLAPQNLFFAIAFPLILLLNLFLHLMHTPLILPRVGVHSTAYVSFLLGLASFFTGLGLWGALS